MAAASRMTYRSVTQRFIVIMKVVRVLKILRNRPSCMRFSRPREAGDRVWRRLLSSMRQRLAATYAPDDERDTDAALSISRRNCLLLMRFHL